MIIPKYAQGLQRKAIPYTHLMQVQKSLVNLDSFIIYICLEGSAFLVSGDFKERLETGELVLVPAEIEQLQIIPDPKAKLLEVYCS